MSDSEQTARSQRTRGVIRKVIFLSIFLTLLSVLSTVLWMANYLRHPPSLNAPVTILIPPGASFAQITTLLQEEGAVAPDLRFTLFAHLKGVSSQLRAGEFRIPGGLSPLEILQYLHTAQPVQHRFTVVEGKSAAEIGRQLEEAGWCSEKAFRSLVHDPEFIAASGFPGITSLEGYLYPDTYYFTRIPPLTAEKIVEVMVRRFRQVWESLDPGESDMHETVILASIVEKETGDPSERPRIAAVFLNRLERKMRLQSDPTVIYGIENFDGNLTRRDLQTFTPYNTYVIPGLPAGPIANPGRESLAAVLQPADEDSLYFVSKNDGTHYFSRSLREHNRAVRKYQRGGGSGGK